ncbi:sodium:solute symporter family protein [Georgenia alba]|uniref:Sodium:solute symporter n=1 Tax=Georgenia alba TaxID=2233858 RepID=A0ABW2Q7L1_9MICO
MSITVATVITLITFLLILVGISLGASRLNKQTPDDFFLADRGLGTVVLMMTTGASFFSTWTLLGAVGSFYRDGVWFWAFPAWTVVHAMFIWVFGSRIWQLGRKFGFVTPGDMVEHYYGSPTLRVLFAVCGIVGLVPYMMIQIIGGAGAMSTLTGGAIPYWVGIVVLGLLVGVLVTLAGGRGAAWTDTFMGFFFGVVLTIIMMTFLSSAGWFDGFRNLQEVAPEILTNKGEPWTIVDTTIGLALGFWVMPHMWQKYYSARSAMNLAKAAAITPLWNTWIMAMGACVIGMLAWTPGLIDGLSAENSDQIIPLYFAQHAPVFGAVVVVAIVAAGISTVNSQLLSSGSLLTSDLYVRFAKRDATPRLRTVVGRACVLSLTALVCILGFTPAAQDFLVPLADRGFAIGSQLVPAALGPLVWRRATRSGALASVIVGELVVLAVVLGLSPLPYGPAMTGLLVGLPVFVIVSLATPSQVRPVQHEYHDSLAKGLYGVTPSRRPSAAATR